LVSPSFWWQQHWRQHSWRRLFLAASRTPPSIAIDARTEFTDLISIIVAAHV